MIQMMTFFNKIKNKIKILLLPIIKLFTKTEEKPVLNKVYSRNGKYFQLTTLNPYLDKDVMLEYDDCIKYLLNEFKDIDNETLIILKARVFYLVRNSDSISTYETKSLLIHKKSIISENKSLKKEILNLNEKYNVTAIYNLSLFGHIYEKNYKLTEEQNNI